ncbi:MAG: secretin N-terminal domain-containing protein, partial [Planctomycetota bacterium]
QPAPITRVFRLRYLKPAEAAAAVKAVLATDAVIVEGGATEEGAASGGTGGSAGGDSGGSTDMGAAAADYIVVTDRPDRLDAAEKLLADIDRKPDQVLVEATVLRATLNESNQLGIDFTILCGVDFRNVNSLSAAGANLTTGQLPAAEFEDTTVNVNTDFAANVADGGFTFGIIHNNVAAFIRALETVTDVVVVANPKVVALNKQEGEVIVGRRDGYLTTLVTETAAIQKVDFLETGTQIRFRPLVLDDGTVRLVVHPKDSNGGLTAANLPFEETTEAHADVLVPDGGTVLIGGLFRERTISGRSQIPGIGNIPLLGLLFGSVNDATTREEVIILLTVHIVRNTPQELDAYRELLEDVERIRVGSRRGLLGTGRERLAQAHYHEALRNLERGQDDLALLNLRMTLNNQPKHTPAIKLRDSLLQRRTWDDDGSRMRTFIHELIDPHGRKLDREVFGRPAPELLIEPPEPPPENPPEPLVPPPAPRPEATGGAP